MNPGANTNQKKILIVEDEAILAKTLDDTLTAMGYAVVGIADTGVKAIMQFYREEPDLVLMDIHLKGSMDGITAAEKIRSQELIPIVFLTANQDPATFERAKIDGACGYVLKPFQERELQIIIEIALSQFQARKKNSELVMKLLDAERESAIGTVLAGVREEIQQPLVKILSDIGSLNKKIGKDPELKDHPFLSSELNQIDGLTGSVASKVENFNNIFECSEQENSGLNSVLELCKEAIELCGYSALNQRVKFKELLGSTNSIVYCVRTKLIQVLVELIRKACDAIEFTPNAWIQIGWKDLDSDFIALQLLDSGNSASKDGLGFSLCTQILKNMGASILQDTENDTTYFTLKLPKK